MGRYHDAYYLIYPPPAVAARAAQWNRRLQATGGIGAPMPPERLHITLHALGRFEHGIPHDLLHRARAVGQTLSDEPFDVALDVLQPHHGKDGSGSMALVGRGPAVLALRRFQRNLGDAMRRMGFSTDQIRVHFSPHMTLDYAHPRLSATKTIAPIAWQVTQLFLVDSLYGQGRHEVLARWPLSRRQQVFSDW